MVIGTVRPPTEEQVSSGVKHEADEAGDDDDEGGESGDDWFADVGEYDGGCEMGIVNWGG